MRFNHDRPLGQDKKIVNLLSSHTSLINGLSAFFHKFSLTLRVRFLCSILCHKQRL